MSSRTSLFIRIGSISMGIIAAILIIQLFTHSTLPNTEQPDHSQIIHAAFPLPESADFCGEKVPLDRYDVREGLDREIQVNAFWHSQTLLFIKRANRFFPIIEPILKQEGVPDDFKYLAVIESSLMVRAQSPAGASGLWQFMTETAKSYGLEVNKEVDERYHIEKSTAAACRYLKSAKQKLGTWTMAAASYNAGMAGVNKQLTLQKEEDYYNILFGEETGRYVYRILAVKEIMSYPDKYGFNLTESDLYAPITTSSIEVSDAITNFADFAKQNGTNYKTLKNLNSWLRDTKLTNLSKKTYQIKIPQ
ncbi:transglycosylase-like protein with SLT domain [Breznakibacter xylanolyticus]|uniref:Transglycosylase-like protein with SLT domain n=1 Tax=Breznakibacter xylanolyticus TaxID=990 RepID=A0A2W7N3N8_9BACT|nr:lytic transglycosylase domain-containing protein [Breznakibacter xylanolyticus]PZX12967.1 transglycosylase-like protein with SLT domain [Breznakibacter xylanolyticus]